MAVESKHRHYHVFNLVPRQWLEFGKRLGLSDYLVLDVLSEVHISVDSVIGKAGAELPQDFPSLVSDSIFDGMNNLNKKLADFS